MNLLEQYIAGIGTMKISTEGIILEVDNKCALILLKDDEALVGHSFYDIVEWSNASLVLLEKRLTTILTDEHSFNHLIFNFYHEKQEKYLEIFGQVQASDDNSTYIDLCIVDVSDREQHCPLRNIALQREKYIKELGGIGTAEILATDLYSISLRVDQEWKQITGITSDTILMTEYIKMVPERYHDALIQEQVNVIKGKNHFGLFHSFMHPTRGEIWIEAHGRVIERFEKSTRAIVMIQDITLDILKVDELKKTKKKLEHAVDLVNLGYFEVDMKSGLGSWDENCYKIHGMHPKSSYTHEQYLKDVVHPDDYAKCVRKFNYLIEKCEATLLEYRCITEQGETVWIREQVEPVCDSLGNVVTMRGVKLDITAEKHKEQELERYRYKLEESNHKLEEMVTHDELTKIYNRRMFNERFEYEWRRAIRSKSSLSIAIADIDHFKEFNDLYGHLAGDVCLSTVAEMLEQCLTRSTDMVARYGGEEFAFILPDTSNPDHLMEKCREKIMEISMSHKGSRQNVVTISIGCATITPTRTMKKTDLLQAADSELYKAKKNGRNQVCHTLLL